MVRTAAGFVLLLLILLIPEPLVMATGNEFSMSGSDLIVEVNTKWIGCRQGGYYPVRVSVRNNGKPCHLTLEISQNSTHQKFPHVTRSLSLEQNATINTTLLVPIVSWGTYVNFRVLERGRQIDKLTHSISLSEMADSSNVGPAMLIVAKKPEDIEMYDRSIDQIFFGSSTHRHGAYEYTQHVRPQKLPANWLAYTGLDILAIPLSSLAQDVPADARNAIFEWVASGGNLLIYNVAEPVENSASLKNALAFKDRAFIGKEWEKFNLKRFKRKVVVDVDTGSTRKPEDFSQGQPWKMLSSNYAVRSFGLGKVIALSENPFPGTISHWVWLLEHLSTDRLLWHSRNGITSRNGNESFFRFLIPNVGGVPVFSLLILITFFTILIGPVNYIYFLKKRQLAMLLITVPVIAFGSSMLLLGYSTIAHGFSIKSRVRSITFLDQKQNHAMSITRVAYYAGMAPSAGLHFEPTTAVYPIWPTNQAFESARVDWSEKQHLQNGWLRSRTRTQFLTVSQQEQRGRIELQSTKGEAPQISNGLEWSLKTLLIVDQAGKAWVGRDLEAGAVGKLEPLTAEHRKELRQYLSEHSMDFPTGVDGTAISGEMLNPGAALSYNHSVGLNAVYNKSLQEKILTGINPLGRKQEKMQPGSYFAIMNQEPDLDLGLSNAQETISIHLLFGYF